MARRMFCSLFSPKPARSRSFASRASFSTCSTVPALNFLQSSATFFGPSDCRVRRSSRVWVFLQQLLPEAVVALGEDLLDVFGHAVADAGQFGELFGVLGELFDRLGEAGDQLGGALVAAVAANLRAVNFEKLRRLAEDAGDFAVVHGNGL